ncbi:MAG: bifunctional diaminohydroxyphosphoribosylaminopyrimidine deaminase/5-amino-6-(5-phosphoribosylamino)uracil reductase RibD [Bacteroidota bacterium]
MPNPDSIFLDRCLNLARLGGSKVQTNPLVGAVLVANGKIIGEGYHRASGEAHAEINAIQAVQDKNLLKEATLYVSLEPCCIYGKTPPCTNAIISNQIPRVVIGCLDPNPRIAGQGIKRLRDAGVSVKLAKDPQPYQALNRIFFFNLAAQRPYISLKWAQSQDAFIAGLNEVGQPVSTKISAYPAAVFTHRLRATHQAILVGSATANIDNPSLNTRLYPGASPQAIVLGREKNLNPQLQILQTSPTTIVSAPSTEQSLSAWLAHIFHHHQIASILIEGGAKVLQQFIDQGLYEAVYRYRSPRILRQGVSAPVLGEDFPWSGNAQLGPDRLDWYQRPL